MVIPAAGSGSRMGSAVPKQLLLLEGMPILAHTAAVFDKSPSVDGLYIAANISYHTYIMDEIISKYGIKKPVKLAEGGETRQESVYRALLALPPDADIVVIHDGVRPLVTVDVVELTINMAGRYGAAAAGMPVKDTIKQVDGSGFSVYTPDRSKLWMVQTPQTFKYELILKAYEKAEADAYSATDDTMLFERLGHSVRMVEGGYDNIKITTQEDLLLAANILNSRRSSCEDRHRI